MSLFATSVEDLLKIEKDPSIVFDEFNADIAWELGVFARKLVLKEYPNSPVLIDIALLSGHSLFHTATKDGTHFDNDKWVERKKNSVQRFGFSSFVLGQKLRAKKLSLEEAYFVSSLEYASHGGCVPIYLKNFGGVAATLTLSGLAQDEDHLTAIKILKEFHQSK